MARLYLNHQQMKINIHNFKLTTDTILSADAQLCNCVDSDIVNMIPVVLVTVSFNLILVDNSGNYEVKSIMNTRGKSKLSLS